MSLSALRRLRICDVRKTALPGINLMMALEELALMHVSGPSSLGAIAGLPRLRSLFLKNIRSLSDFCALTQAHSLRCLCIEGVVNWNQELSSLDFLGEMDNLEHLHISAVMWRGDYPAFRQLRRCSKLQHVSVNPYFFSLEDNAYLQTHFSDDQRMFKDFFYVAGPKLQFATDLKSAAKLSGDELIFEPRVKGARGYRGPRARVLERVELFQKQLEDAISRARDDPFPN